MARIYRTVTPIAETLRLLEEEMEKNRGLLRADDDPAEAITPDHMLFIRSLTPLIASIDPYYNGEDFTLSHGWYDAEEEADDYLEFHGRLQIIRALLRFRRAKIVDIGRGEGGESDIRTTYTVKEVASDVLNRLREEMPALRAIRDSGDITSAHCEEILQFGVLVDAIDLKYPGKNGSGLSSRGLSLAERWYNAAFWDYEELLPDTPEDCAELFERLYTLLYATAKWGISIVVHSLDGSLCYPTKIYPDQP